MDKVKECKIYDFEVVKKLLIPAEELHSFLKRVFLILYKDNAMAESFADRIVAGDTVLYRGKNINTKYVCRCLAEMVRDYITYDAVIESEFDFIEKLNEKNLNDIFFTQ